MSARGGVNGRAIAYRLLDDAGDPARTLAATRQLVEQDAVFAVVGPLGTEQSTATRDYLHQLRVPQLFVGSGAATFGADFARYPYTIGFQPSYRAEGWIYGRYLARARPGATVAVLLSDDALGNELLEGLRQGIARSRVRIVAVQAHEPGATDMQPQLAALQASGASVLALFSAPRASIQSYAVANRLGWRPFVVTNAAASAATVMTAASQRRTNTLVEGSISIAFLKDPLASRWRTDAGVRLYRSIMSRYAKGANASDLAHAYGMALAYETVRLLKAAGRTPTRAAVVEQLARLRDASNPFLLPGIEIETGPGERFPVEQALLQRWSRGGWTSFGGLWSHRSG